VAQERQAEFRGLLGIILLLHRKCFAPVFVNYYTSGAVDPPPAAPAAPRCTKVQIYK